MLEEAVDEHCEISSTGGFQEDFKKAIAILQCCHNNTSEGAARLYGGALSNDFFEEVLTRGLKGRPGNSFHEVTVTQGQSTGHSRRKCLWRKVRSSKLILSEGKHTVSTIMFKLELKLPRYETTEN